MDVLDAEGAWKTREAGENFPVALRLLPADDREHLHSVYAFARLVDELGDTYSGDRVAALDEMRARTHRIWAGDDPGIPVLRRLAATVHDCALSEDPFQHLIEANLEDQRVTRYPTFADLVGYCRLSADPVGRIVLEVFGASTPDRIALSDKVCTALQVLEHLQDVGEDRRAGRVYLPQDSLKAYDVAEPDLDAPVAGPQLRRLVLAETDRAAAMLREGSALVGTLRGWARVAVAGFVGGGLATVDALRRTGGDVLAHHAAPRRPDIARRALVALVRGHA